MQQDAHNAGIGLPGLIDVHLHVGRLYVDDEKGLLPELLLDFMDRSGIEQAALLPIESPEEAHFFITTEYVLEICRKHPDRFIPFCNVDPRIGTKDNSSQIYPRLKQYKEAGCKGYGEAMSGLFIDNERLQRVYVACGELHLPIIFHIDRYRNIDEKGFPRLERMLQVYPKTIFVGHGQHFWAEISGDVREERLQRLTHGGDCARGCRSPSALHLSKPVCGPFRRQRFQYVDTRS